LNARAGFEHDNHVSSFGISAAWGSNENMNRDLSFRAEGRGWNLDRGALRRRLAGMVSELGGLVVTEAEFLGRAKLMACGTCPSRGVLSQSVN